MYPVESENIKVGAFLPTLSAPAKWTLSCSWERNYKSTCQATLWLVVLGVCVSAGELSPQGQGPPGQVATRGFGDGQSLPASPASVLQIAVAPRASPDWAPGSHITQKMSEPRYPLILPEPKLRLIVLLMSWKVLDWLGLNLLFIAANTRDVYLSGAKDREGGGKGRTRWVGGAGTHSSWNFGSRQRAPTSQMNWCQRWPGTVEGVFQWWCCRCRPSTGAGEGRLVQASLLDHPWFPEYCFPLGNPGLQKSLSNLPPHSLCSD